MYDGNFCNQWVIYFLIFYLNYIYYLKMIQNVLFKRRKVLKEKKNEMILRIFFINLNNWNS